MSGATGPTGATGPRGASGLRGPFWRDSWNSEVVYDVGDVTYYDGSSYIMTVATGDVTGNPRQVTDNWHPIVLQGSTGGRGQTGPRGYVGASGIRGLTGATGARGNIGSTGPRGSTGLANWSAITGKPTIFVAEEPETLQLPLLQAPSEKLVTATISSSTLTLDLSLGTVFAVTRTSGISTITFSNVPESGVCCSVSIFMTGNGTAHSVTWPAAVKWPAGIAPTLTSTSGRTDLISLVTQNGGTSWAAFVAGQDYAL